MKVSSSRTIAENNRYLLSAARTISFREKAVIFGLVLIQIALSILDLIGVALLGLVGAISISGIQSTKPSGQIVNILNMFHLGDFSFQRQVAILAILAAVILFSRTALSVHFTRKTLFYFARNAANLSGKIIERLLARDLLFINKRESQETIFATTLGCNLLMVGILAQAINLVSDIALLMTLGIGIFLVQPMIAISSILIFGFSAGIMHFFLNTRAQKLGKMDAELTVASNSKLMEVLNSYREIFVHNQRSYYSDQVKKIRIESSRTQAELTFLPNVNKYIVESTLLLGALVVSAIQFIALDAKGAFTALTLFLAAGTRLAPALLRVQQGMLSVRNSLGGVQSTLNLLQDLNTNNFEKLPGKLLEKNDSSGFTARIEVRSLDLKYPNSQNYALKGIDLVIQEGSAVAVVGPSGAGKTSLVDVILGIIEPTSGEVSISRTSPVEAIETWPTAISYIPQETYISNTSLKDNVIHGFETNLDTDRDVISALKKAQLYDFAMKLPNGVDTQVGENGGMLSGGQRQRLGIARALFPSPKLLILDEATSSLDAETEEMISSAINSLRGNTTVISIAHRLSTVRNADLVVYLENGKILSQGKFEEVRAQVPQFDKQAKLMGL